MAAGVDVIVVNYRTTWDLLDFLRSYAKVQDETPSRLHIVEVDPLDPLVPYLDEPLAAIHQPVEIIVVHENIGYARACNKAAARSESETLAFFNADTQLTTGTLRACHAYLHEHADVGVVGPRQVDLNGLLTHGGVYGTNERPSFAGRWRVRDVGQFSDPRECVSVSGSAYFVKRACWEQLAECPDFRRVAPTADGAFLPTQHYYEETYLSFHARHHDWKVMYLGTVAMVHKWHQASPVGEIERTVLPKSLAYFRSACDAHGIPHE